MILLIGVILGCFVAWQVRHLGLYIALCDAFGITLAGAGAMAYVGKLAELVPLEHPLKGTACLLVIWLFGWMAFRSVARSFPGDVAVVFPRPIDRLGGMVAAFGATMVFVGMVSLITLTTGELLSQIESFVPQIRDAAAIAVRTAGTVGVIAGSLEPITLDRVVELAGSS